MASSEAEVARKEGERQAMERQVAEVQEEVKTAIGRLRTLKQEKDHSQAECERQRELVSTYEEQLKRKEATIKDQQSHLLALSEKITEQLSLLNQAQLSNQRLRSDYESLQMKNEELKQDHEQQLVSLSANYN